MLFLQPSLFLSHLLEVPFPAGSEIPLFGDCHCQNTHFLGGKVHFFRLQLLCHQKRAQTVGYNAERSLRGSFNPALEMKHSQGSTLNRWIKKDFSCSCPHLIVPHLPLCFSLLIGRRVFLILLLKYLPLFIVGCFTLHKVQIKSLFFPFQVYLCCGTLECFPSLLFFFFKGKFTNSSHLLIYPHGTLFFPGFPPRSQYHIKVY